MPAAVPALATIGGWLVGSTIGRIVGTILINVALGALSKTLTKKPKVHAPPINVTVRNPVENRRLVWGTVRVGGTFVFYDVSGTNNKYLWYVVALAGHQVADIKDIWLDTQRVSDSIIGSGAPEGGAVPSGAFGGKLWIYKHLGTSVQNADVELNNAFVVWTGNHRLRGIAYVVICMERDDEKFPQGAPQNITALLDGALLYDPRLDSTNGGSGSQRMANPSTWAFSRNPALIWRWYVSGGSVHNDATTRLIKYGLRDADSRIPDDYVSAAANICDEVISGSAAPPSGSQPRYRCDLEVSTGESRRDIIEDILATMAGSHVPVHGQHRVFAGAYATPTHTFTERDVYGQLEVEDTVDHARRYNAVAGVFRDGSKEWVEQTTIFRTDSAYETQDGGKRIEIEIDLRGVTDQYQAQRLCEIRLRKSRMMRSVKLVGALNFLRVAQNDTLTYTHPRFNWAGRTLRCLERQLEVGEGAGRISLTCQAEDVAVYANMLTADYTTGTSNTDVFRNETPDPPTALNSSGLPNAILWQWGKPLVNFPGTSYTSRFSTASSMTSPTTDYQGPDLQFVQSRTTTALIYRQVASVRNKVVSSWYPLTVGVPGKASEVSAVVNAVATPGGVSSATGAASQTTASVTVTASGGTPGYTYAWTWASGGSGITITSASSATTTFSATSLTSGQTRTGIARCTATAAAGGSDTVDVTVSISRPAAVVTAPQVFLWDLKISPNNANVNFRFDADGHWYSGLTASSPTTDRGLWCNPETSAADYAIRLTRTAGSETVFSSGPAMNTWHAMSADREWFLAETSNITSMKDITFTIEFRRVSDSVVVSTRTGNLCEVDVEQDI